MLYTLFSANVVLIQHCLFCLQIQQVLVNLVQRVTELESELATLRRRATNSGMESHNTSNSTGSGRGGGGHTAPSAKRSRE
jgi:hypothetical protein